MSELESTSSETEATEQELGQAEPSVFSEQVISPGDLLQKKREELGYSVERVAEALHMTARYVRALESGEYHILPGTTFVKGYLKSYAALLNVSVEEIMICYKQYSEALDETEEWQAKAIRVRKNNDQHKRWLFIAAVIIAIVVGVSWWYK